MEPTEPKEPIELLYYLDHFSDSFTIPKAEVITDPPDGKYRSKRKGIKGNTDTRSKKQRKIKRNKRKNSR